MLYYFKYPFSFVETVMWTGVIWFSFCSHVRQYRIVFSIWIPGLYCFPFFFFLSDCWRSCWVIYHLWLGTWEVDIPLKMDSQYKMPIRDFITERNVEWFLKRARAWEGKRWYLKSFFLIIFLNIYSWASTIQG